MFRRLLGFIITVAAIGGLAVWSYFAVVNQQININTFFVGGMTRGVDISSYQTDVDMKKLKEQGIEFAYIKATEGSSHKDTTFDEKWAAAQVAGLPAGAYHYFSYGSSGVSQAENFIKTVGDLDGRLIPAIDMELTTEEVKNPPEKDAVVRGLKAFVAIVEEHYGVKPLIYSRQDYYDKYLKDDFAGYPRWITNVFYPVFIEAGEEWAVWQYSMHGTLEGYGGEKNIDLNVVNKKIGLDGLRWK